MAGRINNTLSFQVSHNGANYSYQNSPQDLDQTNQGVTSQVLEIPTTDTVITFPGITTPGLLVMHNLDQTNEVNFGPESAGAMTLLGKLRPGKNNEPGPTAQLEIGGAAVVLRMAAKNAACKVLLALAEA